MLPADIITWTEDVDASGTPINIGPNAYSWTMKAYAATDTTSANALFTKSTGITASATTITLGWTALDLGVLTSGDYRLRLSGTLGGLPRIHDVSLKLT